jgi:hypothetical protein
MKSYEKAKCHDRCFTWWDPQAPAGALTSVSPPHSTLYAALMMISPVPSQAGQSDLQDTMGG